MAPNKLEDRIREQLQEREIMPSGDAWNKMEARLGTVKKKNNNRVIWYTIAASFIGLLILASVFVNDNSSSSELVVEDTETQLPTVNEEIIKDAPNTKDQEVVANADETYEAESYPEISNEITPIEKTENTIAEAKKINKASTEIVIAEETNDDLDKIQEPEVKDIIRQVPQNDEERFIQQKVDEVVAQIEKEGLKVTPEEVDNLLLNAQKEISKQRILNSQTKKVDAAALLSDVEFELERGFRNRVFDALGDGFNKIRTAVAERNN